MSHPSPVPSSMCHNRDVNRASSVAGFIKKPKMGTFELATFASALRTVEVEHLFGPRVLNNLDGKSLTRDEVERCLADVWSHLYDGELPPYRERHACIEILEYFTTQTVDRIGALGECSKIAGTPLAKWPKHVRRLEPAMLALAA